MLCSGGRNFDPETRTLRKHMQNGRLTQDTVEKDVEGMAEKIIAEDEQHRAQELVGGDTGRHDAQLIACRTCSTLRRNGRTGISREKRRRSLRGSRERHRRQSTRSSVSMFEALGDDMTWVSRTTTGCAKGTSRRRAGGNESTGAGV